MSAVSPDPSAPSLEIAPETVCFLVLKAREFDVKEGSMLPEEASNAADDEMHGILEDSGDDPVREELSSTIANLAEEEQIDLVALFWLGRGDAGLESWAELRREAARAFNDRTADYLLEQPLLPDCLEAGLAAFGSSCEEFERARL